MSGQPQGREAETAHCTPGQRSVPRALLMEKVTTDNKSTFNVARPLETHGQGTMRAPYQWVHFGWAAPGPSGPLDIVHPVHQFATHRHLTAVDILGFICLKYHR